MSSSSPTSLLNLDLQPGTPPMLRAEATGDPARWAAEHRDALRAAVAEHGSLPSSRARSPRRGRDRGRLSAAGHSDEREGGLQAPTALLARRVLLIEVAAQPADVHAP